MLQFQPIHIQVMGSKHYSKSITTQGNCHHNQPKGQSFRYCPSKSKFLGVSIPESRFLQDQGQLQQVSGKMKIDTDQYG